MFNEFGFFRCDLVADGGLARMDAPFLANGDDSSIQFDEGGVRRSLAGKEIAATTARIHFH